mgnify:FL=1
MQPKQSKYEYIVEELFKKVVLKLNDKQIVALYFKRDEKAIEETALKYGQYCFSVAINITGNKSDAEECVNDTYLSAWNSIPPHNPSVLSTFLGKITRRISIDKWRKNSAEKRGSGQTVFVLDELSECIPDKNNVEHTIESKIISEIINSFIKDLPDKECRVFLCRYFYLDSVESIAERFGYSQSKVKSMLHRTRQKLRARLEKEGLK